ncbi:aminotransferase class I/II-fold pyridoxal phosphate-dependent enzyme [Owenweeksia hongkongensis]|uniref:7-keto-8-aminopelargonate synthetase-like enzyme n=1 Tax=Owenweeksia hongkongensis (strain DSM 17368 / CIP 108786 / JCM 12287 / NRRL B-23963 / UST20020801) TaxID=926562 RepID=G8R2Z4_OWEHD|nr:aminotransferase class I/II-fold pyridoxal phosphate-dependent enzyme [Owenweeksia hongkongensis]AEV32988.1 7-keto-8-aminopelargonate synthetase-like enzyme [Owenweeksia hongkongensis DSM 17368]
MEATDQKVGTVDLFSKIVTNKGPLGQYADAAEGYYIFPKLEGRISNRMKFHGKEVICWSINNYLGLAEHPEIRKADAEASADWGLAYPMGSRMMSGNTDYHDQLENELAEFVGKEKAVLVNFGYQGIMSAIDSVLDRNDVVVYDSESHACIVDGVRMHLGKRLVYAHNDMDSLEKNLQRATKLVDGTGGGILVITEGVFGMRGDQGLLKEVVALKEKYNFRLMVDDAHGFGTLGKTGAGAGEEQGVQDDIDIYFATFAKSMASVGAFLAGDKDIIQYLQYNMRSQIFAKSLPMPLVVGNLKRLELLKTKPELKQKLWENASSLQKHLTDAGFDIGVTNSCVTPVYMKGSVEEATQMVMDLRENFGIFCSIVVYPVIPKGMILLRLIPTAMHNEEDIELTIEAFKKMGQRLSEGYYKQEMINPAKEG